MDTWATSSLTPQIVGGWETDPDLFAPGLPDGPAAAGAGDHPHLAVRHGGPRRTWSTACCPGATPCISGWILDPDRKKMSKSKGNVVTPMELLEQHGSDAVRYWAANGRPGIDLAFDPAQIKVGRRLATKLLNASRFALGLGAADALRSPVDRAAGPGRCSPSWPTWSPRRPRPSTRTTTRRAAGDRGVLLDVLRRLHRAGQGAGVRRPGRAPTRRGRRWRPALSVQLRLFAPFLPYVTEEVWSWWRYGSVHRAPWPTTYELARVAPDGRPGAAAAGRRRAEPGAAGQVGAEAVDEGGGAAGRGARPGRAAGAARAGRRRPARAGRIGKLDLLPDRTPELVIACAF